MMRSDQKVATEIMHEQTKSLISKCCTSSPKSRKLETKRENPYLHLTIVTTHSVSLKVHSVLPLQLTPGSSGVAVASASNLRP